MQTNTGYEQIKTLHWHIEAMDPPQVLRHCRRCGGERPFASSGMFRINAQHHRLDIWLIYRCAQCETTWKMTIHNRVHPASLDPVRYDEYLRNDPVLARRCAMDRALLDANQAALHMPSIAIRVRGPAVDLAALERPVEVTLTGGAGLGIPLMRVLREKLAIPRSALDRAVRAGLITCDMCDVKKGKLREGLTLALRPAGGHPIP